MTFKWNEKRQLRVMNALTGEEMRTKFMRSDREVLSDPAGIDRGDVELAIVRVLSELLEEHEVLHAKVGPRG